MAQESKGSSLTRDELKQLLLQDEEMANDLLDEARYTELARARNTYLRAQIGDEKYEELFGNEPLIGLDETVEKRRERFDHRLDDLLKDLQAEYDSVYIKKNLGLAEALQEKRIPVIRADGMNTSGVLNKFDGMKIGQLDVSPERTKFRVTV